MHGFCGVYVRVYMISGGALSGISAYETER